MRIRRVMKLTAGAALALALVSVFVSARPALAQVTSLPAEAIAERLLAGHNAERQRLGLRPLVWSAKLAAHAKKWSQALAVSDMFEHSTSGAEGGEGENLWFGSKDDYTPEEMVGFFIEEGKLFKRGVFPDVTTTSRWEDVGHYTQMIWQNTRELGCAITSNPRRDILVCRYSPMGNIVGQKVYDYGAPVTKAVAAAPTAEPAPVSPSKPKKRASKKRRRGG
ncbi:MAG: CAP domain-containing protein [Novosphingobium sp.]